MVVLIPVTMPMTATATMVLEQTLSLPNFPLLRWLTRVSLHALPRFPKEAYLACMRHVAVALFEANFNPF